MTRFISLLIASLLLLPAATLCAQRGDNLYSQVRQAAVEILVDRHLAGSGCIVHADGMVLTAAHVIKNVKREIEIVSSGTGRATGTVVAVDAGHDLALLKLPNRRKPYAFLPLAKEFPAAGTTSFLYGTPFFRHDVMIPGVVARNDTTFEFVDGEYIEVIPLAAMAARGFSGGPWVNARGEVIGIQSSAMSLGDALQGLAFAAPLKHARQLLKSRESTTHISLGAGVEEIGEQQPGFLETLPADASGLVVRVVHKGGAIDVAGIAINSIISAIDKKPVERRDELLRALWRHQPGDTVELTVSAPDGTQKRTVSVRLQLLGPNYTAAYPSTVFHEKGTGAYLDPRPRQNRRRNSN